MGSQGAAIRGKIGGAFWGRNLIAIHRTFGLSY